MGGVSFTGLQGLLIALTNVYVCVYVCIRCVLLSDTHLLLHDLSEL